MAQKFDRKDQKRQDHVVVLEQLSSEEELQSAIREQEDAHEEALHQHAEEYSQEFARDRWIEHGEDMDAYDDLLMRGV